jgi:hypothetical protein
VGYLSFSHLAPAVMVALMFCVGLVLSWKSANVPVSAGASMSPATPPPATAKVRD